MMKCPACQKPMDASGQTYECQPCQGVFAPTTRAMSLLPLNRASLIRAVRSSKSEIPCAHCGDAMLRLEAHSLQDSLTLFSCAACQSLWIPSGQATLSGAKPPISSDEGPDAGDLEDLFAGFGAIKEED